MTEDDFLPEAWILRFLGWKEKTLLNKRSNNEDLPPCIEKGRTRRYPKREFFEWYTAGVTSSKKRKSA